MNRAHFQQLAMVRLQEAEALFAAGLWEGAYYLAGYVVECGLKACILARIEREGVIFTEAPKGQSDSGRKFSENCWTHKIDDLIRLAGLQADFEAEKKSQTQAYQFWVIATDWSETSRYKRSVEAQARDLLTAIKDPTNGVLKWIQPHW